MYLLGSCRKQNSIQFDRIDLSQGTIYPYMGRAKGINKDDEISRDQQHSRYMKGRGGMAKPVSIGGWCYE